MLYTHLHVLPLIICHDMSRLPPLKEGAGWYCLKDKRTKEVSDNGFRHAETRELLLVSHLLSVFRYCDR